MVINFFFFKYSIIIIFGKGEGGRGLIFGGDIVCRIRGLTFGGGGAYFREKNCVSRKGSRTLNSKIRPDI